MTGNWEGAAPWVGREFFDRLAQQGILYFAWVHSLGYHDRVAMEKALFFAARPVVATFGDVASAYDWLRGCPLRPWKSCL